MRDPNTSHRFPPVHGFGDPYLPTKVTTAPSGSPWVHEIKHDGYRLMVRRTPDGVRSQDGVADFDRLHGRRHDGEVQLLGFNLLELDGTNLRKEPLMHRKATLASLLRRSRDGIQLVEHIEADDGRTVFEHACKLRLEGTVSKRRDKPYQHGHSRAWLKIKNPSSPAMLHVWEDRF